MSEGRANYFSEPRFTARCRSLKTSPEQGYSLAGCFAVLAIVLLMSLSSYGAAILSGIEILSRFYPEILSWTIPFLSAMHCPV